MSDHLKPLNKKQKEAVTHIHGPLRVVAGAGTGKTRVLTHRIAHLISSEDVSPQNILALTFTNKAAKEMKERVEDLTTAKKQPFISTFHALGTRLLRQHGQKVGVSPQFVIRDQTQTRKLIKQIIKEAGFDPKQWKPKNIQRSINQQKSDGITAKEFASTHRKKRPKSEVISQIWQQYRKEMRNQNAVDFGDLLLLTRNLLDSHSDIREKYQNKWQFLHVDEYQDTNRLQYQLINLLADSQENICVVGDGDQTIYTWRGATLDNILSFSEDFSDAKTVTLSQNYRSKERIIKAANNIIEKNDRRDEKQLVTNNKDGEKLELITAHSETNEAQQIAQTMTEWKRAGNSLSDWAVFYRTNFQSRVIEEALNKAGINYHIAGTSFFDRQEVRDVLAYINYAMNRDSTADMRRIISTPPRGIGDKTVSRIVKDNQDEISSGRLKKVKAFERLMAKIEELITTKPPSEAVKQIIEKSGLKKMYEENGDEKRLKNATEIASMAAEYDNDFSNDKSAMRKFLENIALSSDQDTLEEGQAVQLMTVHAAKGLEFPRVWISGLEDDLFPRTKNNSTEREEEERRLFYVALTRAQEKVVLSYAQSRQLFGKREWKAPSPFLSDINDNLLDSSSDQSTVQADNDVIFFD